MEPRQIDQYASHIESCIMIANLVIITDYRARKSITKSVEKYKLKAYKDLLHYSSFLQFTIRYEIMHISNILILKRIFKSAIQNTAQFYTSDEYLNDNISKYLTSLNITYSRIAHILKSSDNLMKFISNPDTETVEDIDIDIDIDDNNLPFAIKYIDFRLENPIQVDLSIIQDYTKTTELQQDIERMLDEEIQTFKSSMSLSHSISSSEESSVISARGSESEIESAEEDTTDIQPIQEQEEELYYSINTEPIATEKDTKEDTNEDKAVDEDMDKDMISQYITTLTEDLLNTSIVKGSAPEETGDTLLHGGEYIEFDTNIKQHDMESLDISEIYRDEQMQEDDIEIDITVKAQKSDGPETQHQLVLAKNKEKVILLNKLFVRLSEEDTSKTLSELNKLIRGMEYLQQTERKYDIALFKTQKFYENYSRSINMGNITIKEILSHVLHMPTLPLLVTSISLEEFNAGLNVTTVQALYIDININSKYLKSDNRYINAKLQEVKQIRDKITESFIMTCLQNQDLNNVNKSTYIKSYKAKWLRTYLQFNLQKLLGRDYKHRLNNLKIVCSNEEKIVIDQYINTIDNLYHFNDTGTSELILIPRNINSIAYLETIIESHPILKQLSQKDAIDLKTQFVAATDTELNRIHQYHLLISNYFPDFENVKLLTITHYNYTKKQIDPISNKIADYRYNEKVYISIYMDIVKSYTMQIPIIQNFKQVRIIANQLCDLLLDINSIFSVYTSQGMYRALIVDNKFKMHDNLDMSMNQSTILEALEIPELFHHYPIKNLDEEMKKSTQFKYILIDFDHLQKLNIEKLEYVRTNSNTLRIMHMNTPPLLYINYYLEQSNIHPYSIQRLLSKKILSSKEIITAILSTCNINTKPSLYTPYMTQKLKVTKYKYSSMLLHPKIETLLKEKPNYIHRQFIIPSNLKSLNLISKDLYAIPYLDNFINLLLKIEQIKTLDFNYLTTLITSKDYYRMPIYSYIFADHSTITETLGILNSQIKNFKQSKHHNIYYEVANNLERFKFETKFKNTTIFYQKLALPYIILNKIIYKPVISNSYDETNEGPIQYKGLVFNYDEVSGLHIYNQNEKNLFLLPNHIYQSFLNHQIQINDITYKIDDIIQTYNSYVEFNQNFLRNLQVEIKPIQVEDYNQIYTKHNLHLQEFMTIYNSFTQLIQDAAIISDNLTSNQRLLQRETIDSSNSILNKLQQDFTQDFLKEFHELKLDISSASVTTLNIIEHMNGSLYDNYRTHLNERAKISNELGYSNQINTQKRKLATYILSKAATAINNKQYTDQMLVDIDLDNLPDKIMNTQIENLDISRYNEFNKILHIQHLTYDYPKDSQINIMEILIKITNFLSIVAPNTTLSKLIDNLIYNKHQISLNSSNEDIQALTNIYNLLKDFTIWNDYIIIDIYLNNFTDYDLNLDSIKLLKGIKTYIKLAEMKLISEVESMIKYYLQKIKEIRDILSSTDNTFNFNPYILSTLIIKVNEIANRYDDDSFNPMLLVIQKLNTSSQIFLKHLSFVYSLLHKKTTILITKKLLYTLNIEHSLPILKFENAIKTLGYIISSSIKFSVKLKNINVIRSEVLTDFFLNLIKTYYDSYTKNATIISSTLSIKFQHTTNNPTNTIIQVNVTNNLNEDLTDMKFEEEHKEYISLMKIEDTSDEETTHNKELKSTEIADTYNEPTTSSEYISYAISNNRRLYCINFDYNPITDYNALKFALITPPAINGDLIATTACYSPEKKYIYVAQYIFTFKKIIKFDRNITFLSQNNNHVYCISIHEYKTVSGIDLDIDLNNQFKSIRIKDKLYTPKFLSNNALKTTQLNKECSVNPIVGTMDPLFDKNTPGAYIANKDYESKSNYFTEIDLEHNQTEATIHAAILSASTIKGDHTLYCPPLRSFLHRYKRKETDTRIQTASISTITNSLNSIYIGNFYIPETITGNVYEYTRAIRTKQFITRLN